MAADHSSLLLAGLMWLAWWPPAMSGGGECQWTGRSWAGGVVADRLHPELIFVPRAAPSNDYAK